MGMRNFVSPVPSMSMMHRLTVERCTPTRRAVTPTRAKVEGEELGMTLSLITMPIQPPRLLPTRMLGMNMPLGTPAPKVTSSSTRKTAPVMSKVLGSKALGSARMALMAFSLLPKKMLASSFVWLAGQLNCAPNVLPPVPAVGPSWSSSYPSPTPSGLQAKEQAMGSPKVRALVTTLRTPTSKTRSGSVVIADDFQRCFALQRPLKAAPSRPPRTPNIAYSGIS
mmetsp:Transcript_12676/g.25924  ORF Transcript_12676/g.25924 Transcript_12676/m.25924 type:complete len:224 (+) Transcript_12676:982-1653(+)